MTIDISANNPRISYSVAAGVTQTTFTVPFEFFDDSDLNVYIDTTLKTITTDYTVSGGAGSTGTIIMSVTGPKTVILTRDTTIERTTDFTAGVDINRAALNTQLDTLTAIAADNQDLGERSIRITDYDPATANLLLPDASTRADKLLSFDTEGDIQVQAAGDLLTGSILGANYTKANYTGNGSQTAYSTVESAGSKNNLQVYVDGVYQNKDTFSISGSTLTFTEAPPLNSSIEFIVGSAVNSLTTDPDVVTYNQGGTGAQDRTLTSKLQDIISVKDFGAAGNGSADDTSAFTAANSASGAAAVFIPAGTYLISGTVTGNFFTFGDVTISSGTVNSITEVSPAITQLSAGAGISPVTNSIFKTSTVVNNNIVTTTILLDLTGLQSGGTAGDIIGKNGSGAAYLGQITAASNGTILGVSMTCLEAPVGGDADIDLYSATEATGVEDTAISALTETQIINSGTLSVGTIARGNTIGANQYLYLVGQGTSNAAYSAGRLLIEITGYL